MSAYTSKTSKEASLSSINAAIVLTHEPRPWHGDLGLTEGAGQLTRPTPVPMADNRLVSLVCRTTAIAAPAQSRGQLLFHNRFEKAAHPAAQRRLDRVKPIVE
jgi:hypothetical protein